MDHHCYGTVVWNLPATGFSMEETPVALASGDIFVDDEGWLVDYGPLGSNVSLSTSWVETGEENYGQGTVYFYAYNIKPDMFMAYFPGGVAQSDERGSWIAYTVRQDNKTSANWHVTISRPSSGAVLYSAVVSVSMTPNTVEQGQELAGQQDAQAPLAFFSYAQWFHGVQDTTQSLNGTVTDGRPPNAGWFLNHDTPSNYGDGGLFFTDCC